MQNFEYTQEELNDYSGDILEQIAIDYKIDIKDKLEKNLLINKIIEVQESLNKKEPDNQSPQVKMHPFA